MQCMPSTLNKLYVNVYKLLEGLGLNKHSEFSILAASSYPFQANSQLDWNLVVCQVKI